MRAFAINSIGVGYGSEVNFTTANADTPQDGQPCPGNATLTDIDGNVYNTVQIGNQCWMKENLRTTKYADNTEIFPAGSHASYTEPYRYAPDNNESNVPVHGYWYNWTAAMHGETSSSTNPSGIQGICPDGWHVPSDAEWNQLANYVGNQNEYACGNDNTYIAKSLATIVGWDVDNGNCTVGNNQSTNNATGFSALPSGYHDGSYHPIGANTLFWTTTVYYEYNENNAHQYYLSYNFPTVERSFLRKDGACSVRCVKD